MAAPIAHFLWYERLMLNICNTVAFNTCLIWNHEWITFLSTDRQTTTSTLLQLAHFFYLLSLYKFCTNCQTMWFMTRSCFFNGRLRIQSKCHYHSFCVTLSSALFAQAFVRRHWVSRFYRLAPTRIRRVCVHSLVSCCQKALQKKLKHFISSNKPSTALSTFWTAVNNYLF